MNDENITPSNSNSTIDVARSLFESGRYIASAACLKQIRQENPSDPEVDLLSAQVSGARKDQVGVLEAASSALKQQPNSPQHMYGYIHALFTLGRLDDALAKIDRIELPEKSPLRHNLNLLKLKCLQRHGAVEEFTPLIKELIAVDGRTPRLMIFEIDVLRRQGKHEEAIQASKKALEHNELNKLDRLKLGLGLARLQDHMGLYEEAFTTAREANNAVTHGFKPSLYTEKVGKLIEFFSHPRLDNLATSNVTSNRPVFVVGMPRSGRSMLEQIIASHPQGGGVGERHYPFILAEDLQFQLSQSLPEALESITSTKLDPIAARYLEMLDIVGATGERVVNKALCLDLIVGFLTVLLPNTRFIWIRRNPADNLLSIYLHAIFQPWCWQLSNLITVRQMHDRLCSHWLEAMPERHIEVSYESLVKNQSEETNRVLSFLDLEPDLATMSFHESARDVMTPSAEQVRQPMHTKAIDRWRNYEEQLQPVLDAFPIG